MSLDGDRRAAKRLKVKSKAQITRRSMRYKLGIKYQDRVAAVASAALARGAVEGAAAVRVLEPVERLEPLAIQTLDVSTARRSRMGSP